MTTADFHLILKFKIFNKFKMCKSSYKIIFCKTTSQIKDFIPFHLQVRFMYGAQTQVTLALPNSYELLEHLVSQEQQWHTVPLEDLELQVNFQLS